MTISGGVKPKTGSRKPTAARIAPLPRAGYSLGLRRGRMMRMHMKPVAWRVLFCLAAGAVAFCAPVWAQQYDQNLFGEMRDRKSTRLNSSHRCISYAVFCLKKEKK